MVRGTKQSVQNHDNDTIVYQARHDVTGDHSLGTSVLMALDELPDMDLEDSDTVLFEHVDLDALDDLFRPVAGNKRNGRVTFSIDEYEVTATATGRITIRA